MQPFAVTGIVYIHILRRTKGVRLRTRPPVDLVLTVFGHSNGNRTKVNR